MLAAALSGAPSTVHALVTGGDPLAAARAAGALLLPRERRTFPLLLAAFPVHVGVSLFWASVIPRRAGVAGGAACGLGIAALDLRLLAPARVRALPTWPQVADHVAFGAVVGWALRS